MGADIPIDYTRTKFEQIAKDVDVVLDTVGRDTLERSYSVVKKGGIIVSIVDDPKPAALEAHGIRGVSLRCVRVKSVKPSMKTARTSENGRRIPLARRPGGGCSAFLR